MQLLAKAVVERDVHGAVLELKPAGPYPDAEMFLGQEAIRSELQEFAFIWSPVGNDAGLSFHRYKTVWARCDVVWLPDEGETF